MPPRILIIYRKADNDVQRTAYILLSLTSAADQTPVQCEPEGVEHRSAVSPGYAQ